MSSFRLDLLGLLFFTSSMCCFCMVTGHRTSNQFGTSPTALWRVLCSPLLRTTHADGFELLTWEQWCPQHSLRYHETNNAAIALSKNKREAADNTRFQLEEVKGPWSFIEVLEVCPQEYCIPSATLFGIQCSICTNQIWSLASRLQD